MQPSFRKIPMRPSSKLFARLILGVALTIASGGASSAQTVLYRATPKTITTNGFTAQEPILSLSADALTGIDAGSSGKITKVLTVTNVGGGAARGAATPSVTGPFSIATTCTVPLAPAAACTISVSPAPTVVGAMSGSLAVAGVGGQVSLSGSATVVGLPQCAATPQSGVRCQIDGQDVMYVAVNGTGYMKLCREGQTYGAAGCIGTGLSVNWSTASSTCKAKGAKWNLTIDNQIYDARVAAGAVKADYVGSYWNYYVNEYNSVRITYMSDESFGGSFGANRAESYGFWCARSL